MDFKLVPLCDERLKNFKADMQEAFQKGAIESLGVVEHEVLPEADINCSLNEEGSAAYEAIVDGESVGGAIVVIDEKNRRSKLDFLYVKYGIQSRGIGKKIWDEIEKLYPETKVWETCTPYFDKRNIHFYINRCGFSAVEFFNKFHPDPNEPEWPEEEGKSSLEGAFRFEKNMEIK